jgi:hypothetical protein
LHFGKISNPKKNTGYNTQNLNFRGVLFGFHSFFHAFNSINDTHWNKVIISTYSWDGKSMHDLIDS